jgi:outer membrane protein assembly factor BamE (lipoprotein component of BamABCDE complex)
MKSGTKLAAIALASMLLSGCFDMGEPYDAGKVEQFVPGETTFDQVIAAMGRPQGGEKESDGSARLLYFHVVATGRASKKRKSQGTYIYFDQHGIYERAETSGLGKDAACQRSGNSAGLHDQAPCAAWFPAVAMKLSIHA